MLENIFVALLVLFAYGTVGYYVFWYYKSDENGEWPNRKH